MSQMFTDAAAACDFILAGNATFTIKSLKSGDHITYRVRKSEDGKVYFVSVRTGGPDQKLFAYLGVIYARDLMTLRLTAKSKYSFADREAKAFHWIWVALCDKTIPQIAEVWHDGRCGRCARQLTDPTSIARGIGPECATKTERFMCEAA